MDQSTPLYPPVDKPLVSGMLPVSPLHTLYYEVCGQPLANREAIPILYVHGGPGGGISPYDRRYFDPQVFTAILFDQRGAGKSTPSACIDENDTWALVQDIEKIREHLGIKKWLVFGGSWGSTLSLAYAISHPTRVMGLILRGIFMLRKCEVDWFYQSGASYIFPDYWKGFLAPIPESKHHDLMKAYHDIFTKGSEIEKLNCARAWSTWECATSKLLVDPEMIKKAEDPKWALAFAQIECHYFVNGGFFPQDDYILKNVHVIRDHKIPGIIVQGRYDVVCPAKSAIELSDAWPEAELHIMNQSGHSAKEPQISSALVNATNQFRDRILGKD